jgi:hypothetical protein
MIQFAISNFAKVGFIYQRFIVSNNYIVSYKTAIKNSERNSSANSTGSCAIPL